MFPILFACFIIHNFVSSSRILINDIHQSSAYHIAYSTMNKYDDFEYHFIGHFRLDRLQQLKIIADEGGSLQSIDCLQFGEFAKLSSSKNQEGIKHWFDGFIKAHQSLLEKMVNFEREMPREFGNLLEELNLENLQKMLKKEEEKGMEGLIKYMREKWAGNIFFDKTFKYIKATKPIHYMAIRCKEFMAKMMSEEGEGSWLDLFTFMPQRGYEVVAKCNEYSKLQSTDLDWLINLAIYRRHVEMRQNGYANGKEFKRTVIVGAGPIGLYTAVQFFLVGMRILVVNDRPKNYIRKQITFLDPKWMVQLRFLLGTKYDVFFRGEKATGRLNPGETGKVNILDLETHLKELIFNLMETIERIEIKEKEGKEKPLEIWYETAFEEIRANKSDGYLAHLVESDKAKNRREMVKRELTKEIREGNIGDGTKEAVAKEILKETLKEVEEEEKGKFEKGKWGKEDGGPENIGPEGVDIPMDFLVCAGGANDRIRDKYLGEPKLMTIERNFGVGMVDKENVEEFIFEDYAILIDVNNMWEMGEFLEWQNFDEFIQKEAIIPVEIKEKYKNFDKILRQMDPKGKQVIRIWENRATIHIAASTPPALENLLEDLQKIRDEELKKCVQTFVGKFFQNCRFYLGKAYGWIWKRWETKIGVEREKEEENIMENIDAEMNRKIGETTKKFKELRQKLERKWFLAVFDYALAQKHPNKIRIDKIDEFKVEKGKRNILFNIHDKFDGQKNRKFLIKMDKKEKQNSLLKLFFADFNVFTFPLRIQGPNASVKEMADLEIEGIKNGKNFEEAAGVVPGLIISLGDSNASPHFLSASGLSTGRVGVEKSAYIIRDYYLTKFPNSFNKLIVLEGKLGEKLHEVKKQVQRKAEGFDKLVSRKNHKEEDEASERIKWK